MKKNGFTTEQIIGKLREAMCFSHRATWPGKKLVGLGSPGHTIFRCAG